MNAEEKRLEESRLRTAHWKRWGPYVSERQWGTVREDYKGQEASWAMNAEEKRLEESRLRRVHWKRWGPYVSERQ